MTKEQKFDFIRIHSECVISDKKISFEGNLPFPESCNISIKDIREWLLSLNFRMTDFDATCGGTSSIIWKSNVAKIISEEV